MKNKPLIGFIGQGWIGKHYADSFENRGFKVVRYSKEQPYVTNKEKIREADIVFIAVPTPTTKKGFNDSIVRDVIKYVGKSKIAVIKSTIKPGITESIQKQYPDIYVLHSPEFLKEKTAKYDATNPTRNIIGIPIKNKTYKLKAKIVLDVLPKAPISLITGAKEAELIKYGANIFLYTKVVYANIMFDLANSLKLNWEDIKNGIASDPRIGFSHFDPIDNSGHTKNKGRGAGGHCLIKDFAAFRELYQNIVDDPEGLKLLRQFERKNKQLLKDSNKDIDILEGVYGKV